MQRSCRCAASLIAAGIVLLGYAAAQQTPATNNTPPAKPRSSATTTQHKSTTATQPLVLTTEKDKQSYAIGLNVGKNLHRDGIDVDPKIVLRGLQDSSPAARSC